MKNKKEFITGFEVEVMTSPKEAFVWRYKAYCPFDNLADTIVFLIRRRE